MQIKSAITGFWLVIFIFLACPVHAIIDPALQMQLGNPSNARADVNNHTNYLIQRSIEALDYNDSRGQANWASWDLTSADANGAVARQDSFAADTNLPAGFFIVSNNAYSGSGYDRGHLCPSADRTDSTNDNDMTFLMSNMMPQAPDNNRIVWSNFEDYCRNFADAGNEVLIMCGPSGFDGSHISSSTHVLIPSNTWKVAVIVPLGSGTALSRITTITNRVISIRVPNTNGVSSNWTNYITSAHSIELETGLSFFTALPGTIASSFRAKIDGYTNGPPAITSFSPAVGLANTNVVITGTNFNTSTVVKFNGLNAVFTVDSNTQITAIVPTNAATGTISVTTPTGTATSGSSFSVTASASIPDLALVLSHSGSYTQQDIGDTLTILVSNVGNAITTGAINVTNILPAGLTATAISGTGWTTSLANLTATRSDALGAGASFPAITVTVTVAANAPSTVTNFANLGGGGESNTLNNSASDIITITPFTSGGGGTGGIIYTGILAGWDVSAQTGYGVSPLAPTTNVPYLSISNLTRASGVQTSGSGLTGRGWGGNTFTSLTSAAAVTANQFVTFGAAPNAGYAVSFTSVSRFDYRRSGTGPTNGVLQYQIGSGAFNDITNLNYSSIATTGGSIGPIDLSGFAALQNVGAGTNVAFRIVSYLGTSSAGTWYIYDVANSTAPDLALQGTVSVVSAPSFQSFSLVNGQINLSITGVVGTSYTVSATTNLINPQWVTLLTTNPVTVPFTFVDTNHLTQRFYRVQNP